MVKARDLYKLIKVDNDDRWQCQVCVALEKNDVKTYKNGSSTKSLLAHNRGHAEAADAEEAREKCPLFKAWCVENVDKRQSLAASQAVTAPAARAPASAASSTSLVTSASRAITKFAGFDAMKLSAFGGPHYHRNFLTFCNNIIDLRPLSTTTSTGAKAYQDYLAIQRQAVPTPDSARRLIDRLYTFETPRHCQTRTRATTPL